MDRSHLLAIGAAQDAIDGVVGAPRPAAERCAVVCGVGYGVAALVEQQVTALFDRGLRGISPLAIPMAMPSSVDAHLSLRFGFAGPCLTVSTACASGADAIGEGVELLAGARPTSCWPVASTRCSPTPSSASSSGWR